MDKNLNLILFCLLLLVRLLTSFFLVKKDSDEKQLILLKSLVIIDYVLMATFALIFGEINNLFLLIFASLIAIRFIIFSLFAERNKKNIWVNFLKNYFHPPYLLLSFFEIMLFIMTLPVEILMQLMMILIAGVLFGWYVNNADLLGLLHSKKKKWVEPFTPLIIFFPRQPKIIDNRFFSFDTFAFYTWIAAIISGIILLSAGLSLILTISSGIFMFAGARLFDWFINRKKKSYPKGYSFYGSVLGVILFILICHFFFHWEFVHLFNLAVFTGVIGHAIGRIGCFAHGCCVGKIIPSYRPYMIAYLNPLHKVNRIHHTKVSYCYPTIVIESLLQMLIAILCIAWNAYAVAVVFFCYGTMRLILQPFRAHSHILFYLFSILFIAIGVSLFLFAPPVPVLPLPRPNGWQISLAIVIAFIFAACYGLRFKKLTFS